MTTRAVEGGAPAGAPSTGWQDPGLTPRQLRLTLAGVMLAMFLASLDQTIVGTALPRIVADLGGFDKYTWVTTAYIVASTATVPIAGAASDIYGRKWLYAGGITVFLAGSILAALSGSMNALIAARAAQGLGGGVMMALSFVTIGDLFPPADRGKYQGLIAGIFGISSVVGPTIGGFLTDNLSWHWIFLVNLPLGVPVIFLFIRMFPDKARTAAGKRIDTLGAALLVLTIIPALLSLSWAGSQYPWGSIRIIGLFVFSAAMGVAFFFAERRSDNPILPFEIFENRIVTVSIIAIFLTGFAMFGAITFVPFLFQGVLGASATASGSFLTPMMLGIVFGAATSGQVLSRTGGHYRVQGVFGLIVMSAGVFMLSRVSASTTNAYALSAIVIMGVGLGTTFPLYTIAVQNAVPYKYLGVATSATQFFRSIGGSIGLALLGSYMVSQYKDHLHASLPTEAVNALPQGQVAQLTDNPNALVSPVAMDALRNAFAGLGDRADIVTNQVFEAIRSSLAGAIADIFMISFVVVVIALVVTLFIKEIPLSARSPRPATVRGDEPPLVDPGIAG